MHLPEVVVDHEVEPATIPRFERLLPHLTEIVYLHAYDPTRILIVEEETIFDITGQDDEHNGNVGWREYVYDRSNKPLLHPIQQAGIRTPQAIIHSPFVNGHVFGTLRDWMKVNHPDDWAILKDAVRSKHMHVVDSYIHAILPLQNTTVQTLLLDIGIAAFEQDYDVSIDDPDRAFGFWPAELAITQQTAELLASRGIDYLILDRHQIQSERDSVLYSIETADNSPLYAIAYNHGLANRFAFHDISDAPNVVISVLQSGLRQGTTPLVAIDWETIGHHRGTNSLYAMNYLANSGLSAVNATFGRSPDRISTGSILPTSWSCYHDSFARWSGAGECDCDGATRETNDLKHDLYEGLSRHIDGAISDLEEDGNAWHDTFVAWFLAQREAMSTAQSVSFDTLDTRYRDSFRQLFVGIIGMTSCGWFFGSSNFERSLPLQCLSYLDQHFWLPATSTAASTSATASA